MNNFYKGGRGLAFFNYLLRLFKSRNNRSRTLFSFAAPILCFMLFNLSEAWAQSRERLGAAERQTEIKPLEIGDTIPEYIWQLPLQVVNHPAGKDTITLKDYRDKKLIILDFWATWCTSCIKAFPKLDTLQKDIGQKEMQIVLVNSKSTRDNSISTKQLFRNKPYLPDLLSVTEDTVFKELFPHRSIPHYVWLRDGRLLATTKAEDLTCENIQKAMAGGAINSSRVPRISFDIRQPLFDNGNGGQAPVPIYKSTLSPFMNGLKSAFAIDVNDFGQYTRLVFTNSPLINLLTYAYPALQALSPSRLILDVEDKSPFRQEPFTKWKSRHLYTYEARFPATTEEKAKELMQSDLRTYFKYDITDTIMEMDCLVARPVDPNVGKVRDIAKSTNQNEGESTDTYFQDYALDAFFEQIEALQRMPVVNETGMEDRSILRLPIDLSDMARVKDALLLCGIEFSVEKRQVPVVILSDKKN